MRVSLVLAGVALVSIGFAVRAAGLHRQATPPQQEIYAELKPGAQSRLAVQPAVTPASDAELTAAGRTLTETLWADLNFEQEFALVSREAASAVPAASTPEALPVERWSDLGADFVVFTELTRESAGFSVALQFVGARGATAHKIAFKSSYPSCVVADARACAHLIADDLHKTIRHLDGVAQTHLAFTSDRDAEKLAGRFPGASQGKEIYISDYDGQNQRRLTANQSLNLAPSWAPDGRTLAYVSYVAQSPDIFMRDVFDARPATRPAAGNTQMENTLPAFSPDGTQIVFSSTRSGNWDIWVVRRDGTGLRNLTNNAIWGVINNCPTWSPTGTQIAFISNRGGSSQLYVIGADGTGLTKLTSDPEVDRPTWSPFPYNDIAYTSGSPTGHDINLIDVGTRQVRVLTNGLGDNGSAAFAPNGLHLAFVTKRWGKEQIAIIDRKGNIQLRITTSGANSYPSWSRTPQR